MGKASFNARNSFYSAIFIVTEITSAGCMVSLRVGRGSAGGSYEPEPNKQMKVKCNYVINSNIKVPGRSQGSK